MIYPVTRLFSLFWCFWGAIFSELHFYTVSKTLIAFKDMQLNFFLNENIVKQNRWGDKTLYLKNFKCSGEHTKINMAALTLWWMGQPPFYHATVALSFQIEICNLDRTKRRFLATSLYKKVISTKNWVTRSCHPTDAMPLTWLRPWPALSYRGDGLHQPLVVARRLVLQIINEIPVVNCREIGKHFSFLIDLLFHFVRWEREWCYQ